MVLYFGSLMYVYREFSRQWSDFSYGEFPRILGEFIAIIHKKWSGSLEFSPVSSHVWFRRWQKTCGFQLNESPFFQSAGWNFLKSPPRGEYWWRIPLYLACSVAVLGQYRFRLEQMWRGLLVQLAGYEAQFQAGHLGMGLSQNDIWKLGKLTKCFRLDG